MTKQMLLLMLSVAWVAALLCGLAAGVCEPVCSAPTPTGMVADPLNCTRFYLCLADVFPSDIPTPCPDGSSFDTTTSDCTGTLPCDPPCALPACVVTCVSDLDEIFDHGSCNTYYVCVNGSLSGPLECPANKPYFDGVAQACSDDENVCCGDPCIAYCYAAGTEAPDPYDCTKYYLCTKVGLADEQYLVSCPKGSNFDVSVGRCVAGAPCNKLCNDYTVTGGRYDPNNSSLSGVHNVRVSGTLPQVPDV
ncbi:uncharacterized protein [Procambarus clarkii]|uniref:uncharacterized protein n=1 Tax=Procambarus clarkii TaxID=6728 RepID=UPI0037426D72